MTEPRKVYLFIDESGDPVFYGNRKKLLVGTPGLLRKLDSYKAHIVVAKKSLDIFNRKHNNNPTEFYFDVLHHLLNGKLNSCNCFYNLYLSQRGNNSLNRFQEAVSKALKADEAKINGTIQYNLEIIQGKEMPEFSIVDYLIWAVQRKLLLKEGRYFDAIKDRFETMIELYNDET